LGRLTAGVAHGFNNLLTTILGNLELLKDRTVDEGSLKLLRAAARSAQLGAAVNAQLLSFARRQTLRPEAVDLNHLLAGMGDLLRTTVGDAIRIETHAQRDAWPALVDPNQIALVIINLVINARDAMPSGGALTIETRNATFCIGNHPKDLAAGDYLALSISDTGTGMSEEVRAKAFEPFFTTKGPGDGSGLGLSMVLGVTVQSRGGIRIESRPGGGTTVEIFLPRAGSAATSAEIVALPPSHPAVVGEVVLVVGDNSDVREVTAAMLASLGYHVLEARSGSAAIAILGRGERVDLMLVDVAMPDMNGIEVARRAREQRPGLPVLFATGYGDAALLSPDEIERSGILRKPYRRDEGLGPIGQCRAEFAGSTAELLQQHLAKARIGTLNLDVVHQFLAVEKHVWSSKLREAVITAREPPRTVDSPNWFGRREVPISREQPQGDRPRLWRKLRKRTETAVLQAVAPMSEVGQRIYFVMRKETSLLRRRWQDVNSVQTYRQKAARARSLAKSVMNPATREQLEIMARDYDKMAHEMAGQTKGCSARGR
jgi:CheY-like chemotaxis protein